MVRAGTGEARGQGTQQRHRHPGGMATSPRANFWVTSNMSRVQACGFPLLTKRLSRQEDQRAEQGHLVFLGTLPRLQCCEIELEAVTFCGLMVFHSLIACGRVGSVAVWLWRCRAYQHTREVIT
jgi:hypothetical protein